MADFKSSYCKHIAVYILVVALVVIGASSQKARKNQAVNGRGNTNFNDDIWTIAVGNLGNREAYLDPISGEPKGFYVDVIDAVCRQANKDCRLVVDRYGNCWTTMDGQEVGGLGLFNFYYDACAAWFNTYTRAQTFQFTDAMAKNQPGGFAVRPGNPDGFDWMDLTGKKIGFVTGFASTPICIARHAEIITGASLSDDYIVYYNSVEGLVQGLIDGEVDAAFEIELSGSDVVDFIETDNSVFCSVDGIGLMTRKDNRLVDWWNPAWELVLNSSEYVEICNNLEEEHGDLPGADADHLCIVPE